MPHHQRLAVTREALAGAPSPVELPVEVWAIVCSYLRLTDDLLRLAATCWTLRPHALATVEHHSFHDLANTAHGQSLTGLTNPHDGQALSGRRWRDKARAVGTMRFLAAHCEKLRSMDLSALTDQPLLLDLLTELPPTLRSLDLSHTSIPPNGLDVLPLSLTSLDLSHTDVCPQALRRLQRLPQLKKLNLSSTAMTVSSLRHVPDSVEELDLSACTQLVFEKGNLSYKFEFNCVTAKWPAALTTLKMAGVGTSPAALFNLPASVTRLDMSSSSFCIPNVDFTQQLPNLKTLLLENCKLNYSDEELWALPEGLEELSLKGSSANTRHVRFLPRSLTSLNLSNTLLTNYSSLYESEKVFYFFSTLHMRLPNLRHLDVRCGYPYGTHKYAQLLREKVASVAIDAPLSEPDSSPAGLVMTRRKGLTWQPRERCAKWLAYVDRCAEARRSINMTEPKEEGTPSDQEEAVLPAQDQPAGPKRMESGYKAGQGTNNCSS